MGVGIIGQYADQNETSQLLVFAQTDAKVDTIRPYIDVFFSC